MDSSVDYAMCAHMNAHNLSSHHMPETVPSPPVPPVFLCPHVRGYSVKGAGSSVQRQLRCASERVRTL